MKFQHEFDHFALQHYERRTLNKHTQKWLGFKDNQGQTLILKCDFLLWDKGGDAMSWEKGTGRENGAQPHLKPLPTAQMHMQLGLSAFASPSYAVF